MRHVEGHFGWRAGAVDEEHHSVGGDALGHGVVAEALAHVELDGLAGNRRHRGGDPHPVLSGEQLR